MLQMAAAPPEAESMGEDAIHPVGADPPIDQPGGEEEEEPVCRVCHMYVSRP